GVGEQTGAGVTPGAPPGDLSLRERGGPTTLDEALESAGSLPRWIGWRLRILVAFILGGCLLVFVMAQWLTHQHRLPITLRASSEGTVKIVSAPLPGLQRLEGHHLENLRLERPGGLGETLLLEAPLEPLALERSVRWIADAADRDAYVTLRRALTS